MTILVVEDEPAVVTFLRTVLERYTLIEAVAAEQAIRLFVNHNRQIDLLIAHVTFPTISGIQVALILREAIPDLPVILVSDYPVSGMRVQDCGDLGRLGSKSIAVLEKPFEARSLLDTVRKLTKPDLHNQTRTAEFMSTSLPSSESGNDQRSTREQTPTLVPFLLAQLREERRELDAAIAELERLDSELLSSPRRKLRVVKRNSAIGATAGSEF